MELPEGITAKAILSGREYGWKITDFPAVLAEATSVGFVCIGGQFQFLLPEGTCEMYWLNANSTPRQPGEPWQGYIHRSNHEVQTTFERLCLTTDFDHETQQWELLRQKRTDPDFDFLKHLIFVAYFEHELATT